MKVTDKIKGEVANTPPFKKQKLAPTKFTHIGEQDNTRRGDVVDHQ